MRQDTWRAVAAGAASGILSLVVSLPSLAAEPAAEDQALDEGCVLRSIELEDEQLQTTLRFGIDGRPSSIGARVEPGEGVVLDLTGCTSAADLSGIERDAGLVSAVQIDHGSATPMAVMIRIRGAFEYSVSSQSDIILLSLRAGNGTDDSDQLVRVLEPLPSASPPASPPKLLPPLPSGTPLPAPSLLQDPPPAPESSAPPPSAPQPFAPPSSAPTEAEQASVIATTVENWARAWAAQRVEDYLASYATDFQPPPGLSQPAWETQRRRRVSSPQRIEIVLEDLEVRVVEPDRALVGFLQSYSSDTYSDRVEKTLTLTLEDGSWRILREETGSIDEVAAVADSAPPAEAALDDAAAAASSAAATETAGIVEGARVSVRRAPAYDATYQFISYPGGDPGWEIGSGSDVVIRAYRQVGVDLQELIHQDILADAAAYGIQEPDPRIDHRRIRNLRVFFRRHGQELGVERSADWRPGDIVFWSVDGKRRPNHLGIVSDRRNPAGDLLVIHHNAGGPPREEDVLFTWAVRAHFRWVPAQ